MTVEFLALNRGDRFVLAGLEFVMTCESCPEQYDVLRDGVQVAYVRLRFGKLRVDMPDAGDETIFLHRWPDPEDRYKGGFDGPEEQREFLALVAEAINKQSGSGG